MSSSFLGKAASIAGRRPAFTEDEGLASIAEMDSGFSAKRAFFSTSKRIGRIVSFPSPRPVFFYDPRGGEPHHFLDSCYLCKKPLGQNSDIYMYRGDTPFCSEWCRQEQIDMDEASEKKKNQCHSSSVRLPSSKADPQKQRPSSSSSSNSSRSDGFRLRAGTVGAG